MFCPKCATQNPDGGSFCRGCGANISLVPQAMTGQITRANEEKGLTQDEPCAIPGRRGRRRELTLDSAFKNMFMGIAFLLIAIALSRSIGAGWWFWMLIPAFSLMATGVAQFIRLQEHAKKASLAPPPMGRSFVEAPRPPVSSVTEGTTRHLGVEAPTRHLDHERR